MASNDRRPDRGAGPAAGAGPRALVLKLALNGVLAAGSLLVTFAVLEVGLRAWHGKLLDFTSQLRPPPNRAATPVADYDPELGWVPKTGSFDRGPDEKWSISDAGLRNNGSPAPASGRPIVVVGDSFTFGDEVMDHETWPAQLEQRLHVPVLNGGVFGYGLDQAYLRAVRLLETHDPEFVLLAFISDDISRAQFSYYSGWKPYFEIENGEPALRNVPVPAGEVPMPRFARLRALLSYSYLSSAVLRRVADRWWSYGTVVQMHTEGEAVAVELLDQLRSLAERRGAKFVAIALATDGRVGGNRRTARVVEQALARGIRVLDLTAEVQQTPPELQGPLFRPRGHYTPPMNGRIAERVAAYLEQADGRGS